MSDNSGIALIHDRHGTPCVSMADAQRLAGIIADDPAQPFDFASSCGYRTELMIGRMLEAGAPVGAIARIFQTVPEDSKAEMSSAPDGRDRGSFHRLLSLPPDRDEGQYIIPGKDLKVTFQGGGKILLQSLDGSRGWNKKVDGQETKGFSLNAENQPWRGSNHITGALYVLDPATNTAQLTVIDPHISKNDPLMTPPAWKAAVNCPQSVVIAGVIGKMADIVTECLNENQRQQFDAALERQSNATDHRQGSNHVVMEMLNLKNPKYAESQRNLSGVNWSHFPQMPEMQGYGKISGEDSKRIDSKVSTDWNSLEPDGQAGLLQRWISELKPLRDLQNLWQEKFSPSAPSQAPEKPQVSSGPARGLGSP